MKDHSFKKFHLRLTLRDVVNTWRGILEDHLFAFLEAPDGGEHIVLALSGNVLDFRMDRALGKELVGVGKVVV